MREEIRSLKIKVNATGNKVKSLLIKANDTGNQIRELQTEQNENENRIGGMQDKLKHNVKVAQELHEMVDELGKNVRDVQNETGNAEEL